MAKARWQPLLKHVKAQNKGLHVTGLGVLSGESPYIHSKIPRYPTRCGSRPIWFFSSACVCIVIHILCTATLEERSARVIALTCGHR